MPPRTRNQRSGRDDRDEGRQQGDRPRSAPASRPRRCGERYREVEHRFEGQRPRRRVDLPDSQHEDALEQRGVAQDVGRAVAAIGPKKQSRSDEAHCVRGIDPEATAPKESQRAGPAPNSEVCHEETGQNEEEVDSVVRAGEQDQCGADRIAVAPDGVAVQIDDEQKQGEQAERVHHENEECRVPAETFERGEALVRGRAAPGDSRMSIAAAGRPAIGSSGGRTGFARRR